MPSHFPCRLNSGGRSFACHMDSFTCHMDSFACQMDKTVFDHLAVFLSIRLYRNLKTLEMS